MVSNVWQYSQKPVGCFPIMCNVLFKLLCPILSLVITISSLLVPTLFWKAYRCLSLASLSHLRCHSLTASFQTIFFPSDFDIFIFTSIFFLIVCLANLSTLSLPKMPTWAGVQISWISLHFSFTLVHVVNFSSNRSWWLLDIPVLRLYSADNESLPIKTSLILSYFLIHSNGIVIAYNSTVYTFRSSVVLLLSSPPWLTIKIADPVLPCSGSFYPSA